MIRIKPNCLGACTPHYQGGCVCARCGAFCAFYPGDDPLVFSEMPTTWELRTDQQGSRREAVEIGLVRRVFARSDSQGKPYVTGLLVNTEDSTQVLRIMRRHSNPEHPWTMATQTALQRFLPNSNHWHNNPIAWMKERLGLNLCSPWVPITGVTTWHSEEKNLALVAVRVPFLKELRPLVGDTWQGRAIKPKFLLQAAEGLIRSLLVADAAQVATPDIKPDNIAVHQGAIVVADIDSLLPYGTYKSGEVTLSTAAPEALPENLLPEEMDVREKWQSEPLSLATGVFSTGITLLRLSGVHRFPHAAQRLAAKEEALPEVMDAACYNAHPVLAEFLLKAIQLEPGARPGAAFLHSTLRHIEYAQTKEG